MTTESKSPDVAGLESGRDWYGYLTLDNAEAVAARLRRLLDCKRFTFVKVNGGYRHWYPEVSTGERLAGEGEGITHSVLGDGRHAIYMHHSGSTGCLYTDAPDGDTAHQRNIDACVPDSERRGDWLWDKNLTYARIKQDRAEIEHYSPGGNRLYWVIVLEGHEEDAL